jgi:hypothetical protein
MTKVQKIYRELRKYGSEEDARYAAVKFIEIYNEVKGSK